MKGKNTTRGDASGSGSKDLLKIQLPAEVQINELKLYDVQGKFVKEFQAYKRGVKLQLLPNGHYILKIHTNKGTVEKKLIVEK